MLTDQVNNEDKKNEESEKYDYDNPDAYSDSHNITNEEDKVEEEEN